MATKYTHMVLDSEGGKVGEHGSLEAAQARVARLVAMSNGCRKTSDYHVLPWQKWTLALANQVAKSGN
jgi:hypothetical protein